MKIYKKNMAVYSTLKSVQGKTVPILNNAVLAKQQIEDEKKAVCDHDMWHFPKNKNAMHSQCKGMMGIAASS